MKSPRGAGGEVHGVAVGVENVEVAIAIEIHQRDPGGAVGGGAGFEQDALAKSAPAVVEECGNPLVLLSEQRHEIESPVAVDIHRDHFNGTGAGHHRAVAPVIRAPVFEHADFPGSKESERSHDEVHSTVVVEIPGGDIRHAAESLDQGLVRKCAVG